MHSDSGCFQPARGVIHPSFPLRGRWGRPASVGEQAPSPSLAFFCKTSLGMHPALVLQITRQSSRLLMHAQACSNQRLPNHSQLKQTFLNSKRDRHSSRQSRLGKSPFRPVAIQYSQPKNTPIAATVWLSQHTIRRINTCGVRIFPKFRRAGASLFLVVWFSCRRTPQSLKSLGPSDRPARSRPAYSRKSNRTQRPQL